MRGIRLLATQVAVWIVEPCADAYLPPSAASSWASPWFHRCPSSRVEAAATSTSWANASAGVQDSRGLHEGLPSHLVDTPASRDLLQLVATLREDEASRRERKKNGDMFHDLRCIDGLLPILKPRGITSADVCRVVRHILKTPYPRFSERASAHETEPLRLPDKPSYGECLHGTNFQTPELQQRQKLRVGHGGTLDPPASGVLVLGVGRGTAHLKGLLDGRQSATIGAAQARPHERESVEGAQDGVHTPDSAISIDLFPAASVQYICSAVSPFGVLPLAVATVRCGVAASKGLDGNLRTMCADSSCWCLKGKKVREVPWETVSFERLEQVIGRFNGLSYLQQPPLFSAKRIRGRHSYELAREGTAYTPADRPPASLVSIDQIKILRRAEVLLVVLGCLLCAISSLFQLPDFEFAVRCSKGTYIRQLAADIAAELGTVGHLQMLVRTRQGCFVLDDCVPLEGLSLDGVLKALRPLTDREDSHAHTGKLRG
ncbi:pseudouridine synthase [Cyclospora cayetanensis]|uniref:tRNA pseudouridine(55) synthase n=1 Tax=Cyclospora cayetanensis TaxID=88456 RepID=A0A1D3DAU5_9EIME|nr:pseudouridine synthase [Cyclospora cayetanensis]